MTLADSVLVQDGLDIWRRLSAVADDADGEKWADNTVREALDNARRAVETRITELNGGTVPGLEHAVREVVLVVYECACGYKSLTPGRCRSHPYPARAMGPQLSPVEYRR